MRNTYLIVDDSKFNRQLLINLIKDSYSYLEAENGQEALQLIEQHSDELCCVLLDVAMPVMNGAELLRILHERKMMDDFPVILVTAEQTLNVVGECFEYGISDYIRKPLNVEFAKNRIAHITSLYLQKTEFQNQVARQTATLKNQYALLQKQAEKLKQANEDVINVLGTVVEYRNMEGGNHIRRIKRFTELIANQVMRLYPEYELTNDKIRVIVSASALHDVGKILIPDAILLKPGKLTDEEFEYMKSHSIRGAQIIEKISENWDAEYVKYSEEITRWHHEKFDGKGYPDGLIGDDIPISAQIVALVDCYDALSHETAYKKAFSLEESYHMIQQGECGVFSPKLLEAFRLARADMEEFALQNPDLLSDDPEDETDV